MKYLEVRNQIIKAGLQMAQTSLTVGTWGNISARIEGEGDLFAITPSGVDYFTMKPEDVVVMDMSGNKVDGDLIPSIEYGLHTAVYVDRNDVNAVVHTHSTYCTALAIARQGIPAACEDLCQIVGGDVRVAKYEFPGSHQLGVEAVKALKNRNAVILANHGLLTAARSLAEAMKAAVVVEKSAHAVILAMSIGKVVELDRKDIDNMRDFYLNRYGQR